jgi:hypothetical protein
MTGAAIVVGLDPTISGSSCRWIGKAWNGRPWPTMTEKPDTAGKRPARLDLS